MYVTKSMLDTARESSDLKLESDHHAVSRLSARSRRILPDPIKNLSSERRLVLR